MQKEPAPVEPTVVEPTAAGSTAVEPTTADSKSLKTAVGANCSIGNCHLRWSQLQSRANCKVTM